MTMVFHYEKQDATNEPHRQVLYFMANDGQSVPQFTVFTQVHVIIPDIADYNYQVLERPLIH